MRNVLKNNIQKQVAKNECNNYEKTFKKSSKKEVKMKTKLQQIYARRNIDFLRSRRYTRVPWLSFRRGGRGDRSIPQWGTRGPTGRTLTAW